MLALISPGFADGESDSTCLPAVQQMVLSFKDKLGAENICIVALHYPFEAKTYSWHGIKVYALAGQNKKGIIRSLLWIKVFRLLFHLRRKHKLQALLSFWLNEGAFLAKTFGSLFNLKFAFWVQGQDARKGNRYIKFIRPVAQQVFSISEFSAHQLKTNYSLFPTSIASNGIRPASFPEINGVNRPIDVIGIGSLYPLKNYRLFVELLGELNQHFPNLRFVHCGEGPQLNELQKLAHSLGLSNQLQFLGSTKHDRVLELLNQSKILLHTSTYEGSSTVTAEALYMGCKVISTFALSSNDPPELIVANTKKDLLEALRKTISAEQAPKRVLSHALSDSINLICERLKL